MPLDKKYGQSGIPSFLDMAFARQREETLHWFRCMTDMIGTSVVGKTPEAMIDELSEEVAKSDKGQVKP